MDPLDPRHGTTRGYHAGCHEACCRAAMAKYEKGGRLARLSGGRSRPALPSQRRIQALMSLGWTSADIAKRVGWNDRNDILRVLNGQSGRPCTWVQKKTHDTIAAAYERMSMEVPELTPWRARARNMAARKGWVPPLAWDDIDNPDETPAAAYQPRPDCANTGHEPHDEAAVLRILGGDWRLPCTVADKREVVARWTLRDPTQNSRGVHENEWDRPSYAYLERLTGWRIDRYIPRGAA